MAIYTITPVLLTTPTIGERVGQGANLILAGRLLYLDGNEDLQHAAATTQAKALVVGLALTSTSAPGQAVHYQTAGIVDAGAAIFGAAGKRIVLHQFAGKIRDEADLATGEWVTYLGVTTSDHEFDLDIMVTDQQAP